MLFWITELDLASIEIEKDEQESVMGLNFKSKVNWGLHTVSRRLLLLPRNRKPKLGGEGRCGSQFLRHGRWSYRHRERSLAQRMDRGIAGHRHATRAKRMEADTEDDLPVFSVSAV